ncbi:MAG: M15 family metallopeptidase [Rhodomicrobium sp.]
MSLLLRLACLCLALLQFLPLLAGPWQASAAENDALIERLVQAYPDYLTGHEGNDIIWKDGTRMPFDDDVRNKPFETLLNKPSLRDEFAMAYPKGKPQAESEENFDPGRIRYQPFFDKMYGDCEKGEVSAKLAAIDWMPKHNGGKIEVTTINGIQQKLQAISGELDNLPDKYMKYLIPSSGVYSCRPIAGTSRKSMHAYAAAIDINTAHSHYWLWSKDKNGTYKYQNEIPYEIAAIFEKHGFIWGAKWYHFDTMHFEYRPEILSPVPE